MDALRLRYQAYLKRKEAESKPRRGVIIVDMLYVFRSQFVKNDAVTEDGREVGGVVGTLHHLYFLINKFRPAHIICVFDGKNNAKARQIIDENYKADRGQKHRSLKTPFSKDKPYDKESEQIQLRMLIDILKLLPVKLMEMDGLEADDIIGYLTKIQFANRGGKRMIVSADRDFIQLLDERTVWYNSRKKKIYTIQNYKEYWDAPIENIPYIRAIEGDSSDNLAGVSGIKFKSLLKILPEIGYIPFKSIEEFIENGIYANMDRLKESNKGKVLVENISKIRNNYDIIQLVKPNLTLHQQNLVTDLLNTKTFDILNKYSVVKMIRENGLGTVVHINKIEHLFKLLAPF